MAPPTQSFREARGTGLVSPTAPLSGKQAFLATQGKQLVQAIKTGAMQRAAFIAHLLSIEIRDGYDPINKRAVGAVQAAMQLEESLRRKDTSGSQRLSKNLQAEAIPLIRTLERMAKEMDEAISQIGHTIARGEAEKAAQLSRTITRTAKLLQDPNVERIRRLGPRMEALLQAVSADPKEAALILALTVQTREVLSFQESSKANKVLLSGRQLLQAERQKSRTRTERAAAEFTPLAEAFLKVLKERASSLPDQLKSVRGAIGKHPLELAPLFDAVRALGISEDRLNAYAESLLGLYRQSRDRSEEANAALEELSKNLKELSKESKTRLDGLSSQLKRIKEEDKLLAFLQDRIFRNSKAYWEMHELFIRVPDKREGGIRDLFKLFS